MPSTTTTKTVKTDENAAALLKAHADAVAERLSAVGAGPRMAASKKVNRSELALWRQHVPFESFVSPNRIPERSYTLTPEQLIEEVRSLDAIANDSSAPSRVRSTASADARKLREQATKRSVDLD